ncbi:YxD-tail cyclophane-containing RiPP peptide [Streptomyces sp. MST-110588]|uniref:YxD-tail cyclophane-containing RiPP peptide n=1 Tax=Streptomyces sp. MST-110588 TaxID=2833628 RepID=UPI001F5D6009|nr:YxD-tail cyclophane-containing RiPP peptide [Streptomyces sp. MST-110588]UNO39961.1 hypothetical protein KGS77_10600 [Streptomyces sp. MST-110588]
MSDSGTGGAPVTEARRDAAPREEALPDFGRPDLAGLRQRVGHPVLTEVVAVLEERAHGDAAPVAYYDDGPGPDVGR